MRSHGIVDADSNDLKWPLMLDLGNCTEMQKKLALAARYF